MIIENVTDSTTAITNPGTIRIDGYDVPLPPTAEEALSRTEPEAIWPSNV